MSSTRAVTFPVTIFAGRQHLRELAMTQASSKITINAPADAIWQVVGAFGAACRYLAMVDDCTVAGEGVGAVRTLTNADGALLVERLEALDESAHRLSYAPLSGRHLATVWQPWCFVTLGRTGLN